MTANFNELEEMSPYKNNKMSLTEVEVDIKQRINIDFNLNVELDNQVLTESNRGTELKPNEDTPAILYETTVQKKTKMFFSTQRKMTLYQDGCMTYCKPNGQIKRIEAI